MVHTNKPKFTKRTLHRRREQHPLRYLREKSSFWIAALSLVAFVAGNMMGKHGWQAFWASVVGGFDDSLIVYTGVVPPIEKVPNFAAWAQYGGNPESHTFRQVPPHLLIGLPVYDPIKERLPYGESDSGDIYSIGYMGDYETGAEGEGSHPGVDIRTPEGTPVRAIANGVVTDVRDAAGYGKIIVIRHPNVPDALKPTTTTVLHSSYAHLSAQFVNRGDIVSKGQVVALSGKTGNVTGPHLHFQIDNDRAEWHPYWPFTTSEMRAAGLTFAEAVNRGLYESRGYEFTIHPMLYVQANYPAVRNGMVLASASLDPHIRVSSTEESNPQTFMEKLKQRIAQMLARRDARLQRRIAQRRIIERVVPVASSLPAVIAKEEVALASDTAIEIPSSKPVEGVLIQHDGSFTGRAWETIRITLIDRDGHTIRSPELTAELRLRTAYGEAEFKPETLSILDFKNGIAESSMLPRGQRTIVIEALPFPDLSAPMRYEPSL